MARTHLTAGAASMRVDRSTIALYDFGRVGPRNVVPDGSGRGLNLQINGAVLRNGALRLAGKPGACAVCVDMDRIAKMLRSTAGMTVELLLSPTRPRMAYRPSEDPGAAPASLGWYWGDVILSLVSPELDPPHGAVLRYNPDVLFWTTVAANGVEHRRGPWFRSVGYLHAPLRRGSWHHVAFTWEKNEVRLYVNGLELATGYSPGFRPPVGPIIVGCDKDGNYPFKGAIKALRISRIARPRAYFKRMFPPAEISLRLPAVCLSGAPRGFVACLAPRHSNAYVLPQTRVKQTAMRGALKIEAAPGQSESVTFAVRSAVPVTKLRIEPTDLTGDSAVVPADTIEISIVKCVYHACEAPVPPNMIPHQSGKKLVPKLLLHDDALVKVDLNRQANAVRVFGSSGRARFYDATAPNPKLSGDLDIRDARTLQPLDLAARSWQQFWVKLHVAADVSDGTYHGAIKLKASGLNAKIELEVCVLAVDLPGPDLDYSIYYTCPLVNRRKISAQQRAKGFSLTPGAPIFPSQMKHHLCDMREHGVVNPIVTQAGASMGEILRLLEQQLRSRRNVGMSTQRLFLLNSFLAQEKRASRRSEFLKSLRALSERYGYQDLACYVIDEPTLCNLEEYAPIYRQIRAAGIKTFSAVDRLDDQDVTSNTPLWRKVKQCISILVASGELRPRLAEASHRAGMEIYSYGNPQVLSTEPETFRRNYGIALWKAGYDGAMDFAYNVASGLSPWNDFDHNPRADYRYRSDQGFVVNTSDGAVGTVAWEGFAAGVDDVRYVSALRNEIRRTRKAGRICDARHAQRWLDQLDPSGDLDAIRRGTIRMILRLRA